MVVTADDKILIKELRLSKRWGVKRIMREFPDKNWKSSTLKDLLRKIDKTGGVQRYPGSGRPKTVRVPDNISMVEDLILSQDSDDTHASPREIERATGISHTSVRRIVKNDLGLKVFKRKRVQVLPPSTKRKRLTCCRNLLQKYTPYKTARIWFSDEKVFPLAAPVNPQNDRVYSNKSKKKDIEWNRLLRQRNRYNKHVMVSGFISKIGKGLLLFVEEGATVNADYYLKLLERHLYVIKRMSGEQRRFTIQQDGATCHTANSVITYLEEHVPDFIRKEEWPPNSCDLNPLDYSVWDMMERIVYKNIKHYENIEELSTAISNAWDRLSQNFLNKSIDQWRTRLEKVVQEGGGHIEHLM